MNTDPNAKLTLDISTIRNTALVITHEPRSHLKYGMPTVYCQGCVLHALLDHLAEIEKTAGGAP